MKRPRMKAERFHALWASRIKRCRILAFKMPTGDTEVYAVPVAISKEVSSLRQARLKGEHVATGTADGRDCPTAWFVLGMDGQWYSVSRNALLDGLWSNRQ